VVFGVLAFGALAHWGGIDHSLLTSLVFSLWSLAHWLLVLVPWFCALPIDNSPFTIAHSLLTTHHSLSLAEGI